MVLTIKMMTSLVLLIFLKAILIEVIYFKKIIDKSHGIFIVIILRILILMETKMLMKVFVILSKMTNLFQIRILCQIIFNLRYWAKNPKLFQIKILYAKLLSIKVFIRKIILLINLI